MLDARNAIAETRDAELVSFWQWVEYLGFNQLDLHEMAGRIREETGLDWPAPREGRNMTYFAENLLVPRRFFV